MFRSSADLSDERRWRVKVKGPFSSGPFYFAAWRLAKLAASGLRPRNIDHGRCYRLQLLNLAPLVPNAMNYALIIDALEAVKLTPTAPQLWQRLSELIRPLDGDARFALIQEIRLLPLEVKAAEWLRCSALAYLTRDPNWFLQQAALVDDQTAPDAIMGLLVLLWHHGVVRGSAHNDFMQFLRDVNIAHLQRVVASHIRSVNPVARAVLGARLRVAVYTPEISESHHGGTAMTLNVLSLLAGLDVQVHAFTAKEASIPAIGSYHGGAEQATPLPVRHDTLTLRVQADAAISLPDTDLSVGRRFSDMLQAIHGYAPDLVIFVGFMSPLVFSLHAHYPIVGLSLHALPPIAPVDVWLSANPDSDDARWPSIPVPQVFPFPFRFWPMGECPPLDAATLALPANAVMLMTVGYRLGVEIGSPWREDMLAFVEAHPAVHWVLIGVPPGETLAGLSHPRIHQLVEYRHLTPWLASADIYVNPPRIGGGGSVAMAMEQGVAVASFTGSDGGDKVGEFALGSSEAYFAQLDAWVNDPVARKQAGDALKSRFHDRLDISGPAAAAGLMQACQQAIAAFNQRKEGRRG